MKLLSSLLIVYLCCTACQAPKPPLQALPIPSDNQWPDDWLGHWEGTVALLFTENDNRRTVNMALDISAADTTGTWNWVITYHDSALNDVRPYTLIAQDSANRHFILDENNSILLDQYRIGNHMMSRFVVDNTMLLASYHLDGDEIITEMTTGPLDAPRVSGTNLPDSIGVESVKSYPLKVLQRAVLIRKK